MCNFKGKKERKKPHREKKGKKPCMLLSYVFDFLCTAQKAFSTAGMCGCAKFGFLLSIWILNAGPGQ